MFLRHDRLLSITGCLLCLLLLIHWLTLLHVEDRSNTQPERRSWHQVRYDTLVRLALVYLAELFLVVDLHPDAVLKHVLNMLFAQDSIAIVICSLDNLLKVRRMAPGDLNSCRSLSYVREHPWQQAIRFYLSHIFLDYKLFWVYNANLRDAPFLLWRLVVHIDAVCARDSG